jgi:hypothetical protein
MGRQQLLLKQELTVSQVLRIYGKHYRQIQNQYSDGFNGRCAIGVLMSYFGWDGRIDLNTANDLIAISDVLKHANIEYDLLIDLNDSGYTFEEIADYLDRHYEIPN